MANTQDEAPAANPELHMLTCRASSDFSRVLIVIGAIAADLPSARDLLVTPDFELIEPGRVRAIPDPARGCDMVVSIAMNHDASQRSVVIEGEYRAVDDDIRFAES